jgi:hypothetical protein
MIFIIESRQNVRIPDPFGNSLANIFNCFSVEIKFSQPKGDCNTDFSRDIFNFVKI